VWQDSTVSTGLGRIRVGVAGWDYPDWNGIVYPACTDRGFDRLRYLSRFVDVIEINSTFYRPATPRVSESWVERTADRPRFTFTAKCHRSWTHEPAGDRDGALAATLNGLTPLRDAGRFGALLVQFPQSFHYSREATEHVERLQDGAADWPLVVEVRHISWGVDAAAAWFAERGLAWCLVDQPLVGHATLGPLPRVTGPLAYARLHGRNARDWFRPDAGRDARYDYRYGREELSQFAAVAREMAEIAPELFVIQNNHFRGQALVNALQLRHLLEERSPDAPPELVAAYPDLEPDVHLDQGRLF
jgi:uncharacterized protein YecE (DUF72 family)